MPFASSSPEQNRERRDAERAANLRALCVPVEPRGSYSGGTTGPAPKGEKARPGKRTPTKAEARWMAQIVAYGCIACRLDGYGYVPAEVHHILRGGVRIGHLHTISLCSGHHRRGAGRPGLIARHPDKTWFELRYGTEAELLSRLRTEATE